MIALPIQRDVRPDLLRNFFETPTDGARGNAGACGLSAATVASPPLPILGALQWPGTVAMTTTQMGS